jgi:hypothetical protein
MGETWLEPIPKVGEGLRVTVGVSEGRGVSVEGIAIGKVGAEAGCWVVTQTFKKVRSEKRRNRVRFIFHLKELRT